MMELKQVATYYGPNPYAASPVVVADIQTPVDLVAKIEQLCGSFRAHFPEWFDTLGPPSQSPAVALGEAVSRWALCALNEIRGFLHASGAMPAPGGVRVWIGFHDERLSWAALQLAVHALSLVDRAEFSRKAMQRDLTAVWQYCKQRHPDYQAQILMQAARASDIPVRPFIQGTPFWQYGWGNRSRVFLECAPNENGGKKITGHKILSKAIFQSLGAPTPLHYVVQKEAELGQAATAVGWPCVVKPVQENKGTGVTAGIHSPEQLRSAYDQAKRSTRGAVMVEAFVPGHDYRLLIADGQLIRAIRREPPSIVGDGVHTIGELLKVLNSARPASLTKSGYLRPVLVDEGLVRHLTGQGFSINSIPQRGQRITLRSNANMSTGGTSTDVTDMLHPSTARMAELIVGSMGLVTAGLDFISADISKSFHEMGAFIEINGNPGLAMLIAAGNDPIVIGKRILGEKPGRIPVTMVVMAGDQLKAALRWLQRQQWRSNAAWACGQHAGVGEVPLRISQSSPWPAVDAVLKHQAVESVSIFCCDQDIMKWGLPVDRPDLIRLCNVDLPDEWLAVLRQHARHFDRLSDWQRAVTIEALDASETALEPQPAPSALTHS